MDDYLSPLLFVVLLALHALLEYADAALNNYRRTPFHDRAQAGESSARRVVLLTDDPARITIALQSLRLFLRFGLAAVAIEGFGAPLIAAGLANDVMIARWVADIFVLLVAGLITIIIGDMLPSTLGQLYADQAIGALSLPLRIMQFLLSPLVLLLLSLSRAISRATGSEEMSKAVTEEEIIALVDVGQRGGTIESGEKEMIYSVLQFGETLVREVMVPRPDMVAVEIDAPMSEAVRSVLASGHSRIPVYDGVVDNVRGFIYAKDLLKALAENSPGKTIRALMRPVYMVPATKRADALFKEMQEKKTHIAILIDEYGSTAGLVTIEDLLEEIVGDIRDEYDINEEADLVLIGENEYLVDGAMQLDDLNEALKVALPTQDNDSIGGYIYSHLGRVPEPGDVIEEGTLRMRVQTVQNRRIRKVIVTRIVIAPLPDAASVKGETGTSAPAADPAPAEAVPPVAPVLPAIVIAAPLADGTAPAAEPPLDGQTVVAARA